MSFYGRDYQALFLYLKSINFHFLDTWVIECANYYKSIKPNISLEELKKEVKQQWLLLDLRKIKASSLPPDLVSKEKIILEGKYAVQVESMIDSSESCYSQFLKMRKVSTENIEATKEEKSWDIKSSRCLTFVISDGAQELQAMEYQPIIKIRTNDPELLPGFKMVIIGPVECRKGMILLKNENVQICGGEVDSLTTTNSLKSILIKKLNLNEDDFFETAETFDTENDNLQHNLSTQPYVELFEPPIAMDEDQNIENLLSQNDDVFLNLSLETNTAPNSLQDEKSLTKKLKVDSCDLQINDFDEFNDAAFNHVFETTCQDHKVGQKNFNVQSSLNSFISSDRESSFADPMDVDYVDLNEEFQVHNSSLPKENIGNLKKPVQTKLSQFFKENNSESNSLCSEKRMLNINQETKDPKCINYEPFVYLKQILPFKLKQPSIFTIKAIILTLTKKVTIKNESFNLKAVITDGSLAIDVEFSSEILENILEFSPCEMIELMKLRQTNNAVADRIKDIFSKAQEKLISLNCLMKVKFFSNEKIPLVLSLEEINNQHLNSLRNRQIFN